jgi:hypothetical protein
MKWDVVLVAIVKDEAPYIIDWIVYHLSLGVQHFVLYDNNSRDDTARTLDKFIGAGIVTLVYWPVRAGQIDAYNHAGKLLRHTSEWIGFLDIDEFVVLHDQMQINAFLTNLGADQVLIPWKNFLYGGHFDKPGGTDAENYFWCGKTQPDTLVQVKHFVKAEQIRTTTAHFSLIDGTTVFANGSASAPRHAIVGPDYKGAQINHYSTRSLIENTERLKKGQVSGRSEKKIADFHRLTEAAASVLEYDDSILRHFNNFTEMRQSWAARAERPHRYGLGQVKKVLQSANPLYYFFLKSYGNFLAGLTEIDHTTKTPLVRQDVAGGREVELSRVWFDIKSNHAYFKVSSTSFQKYFVGSVHYGDFCRRFGFSALRIDRSLASSNGHIVECRWQTGCPVCIFEISSDAGCVISLSTQTPPSQLEAVALPKGRHAGIVYIPTYLAAGATLSVELTGPVAIHELVIGELP